MLLGLTTIARVSHAQQAPATVDEAHKAVEAIEGAFDGQVHAAQVARLRALEALVAKHEATAASWITETALQHAIADDLFKDAAPLAGRVIGLGPQATSDAWLLARIVDTVARVDAGDYDASIAALEKALTAAPGDAKADATAIISVLEVYYHQLLARQQGAVALKAFQTARAKATDPAVVSYLDNRLARLGMIGKPSPALKGTTIDGKPFDLATLKGKLVVVVFWATWCVPNAEEAEAIVEIAHQFQGQGLEIVGVNLDTAQEDGSSLETLLPNIKRFLLDYNVTWPNLINGTGATDYAAAFHVTDLPASVIIDRQGTVIGIDPGAKGLYLALPELLKTGGQ